MNINTVTWIARVHWSPTIITIARLSRPDQQPSLLFAISSKSSTNYIEESSSCNHLAKPQNYILSLTFILYVTHWQNVITEEVASLSLETTLRTCLFYYYVYSSGLLFVILFPFPFVTYHLIIDRHDTQLNLKQTMTSVPPLLLQIPSIPPLLSL